MLREWIPAWKLYSEPFPGGPATLTQDASFRTLTLSAHVDDTFEPLPDLTLVLGVRGEWIPTTGGNDAVAGWSFEDEFAALLPGVGASYAITGAPPADPTHRSLAHDSLALPRTPKSQISAQPGRPAPPAIQRHPAHRPTRVAEFREELLSPTPLIPEALAPFVRDERAWSSAIRENLLLITIALSLAMVALVVTILSPPVLAPTPEMTPVSPQVQQMLTPDTAPMGIPASSNHTISP